MLSVGHCFFHNHRFSYGVAMPRPLQFRTLHARCFHSEEQLMKMKKKYEGRPLQKVYPFWAKKLKSYNQRVLSRRIVELTRRRRLDQVFEEIENAKKDNLDPNRIVMNAAMAACVHCGDLDQAYKVYNTMLESCGVDTVTYATLLKGLGDARRLDEAFELVESIKKGTAPGNPKLSEVHVRTLLNAFADAGEMPRAVGVLIQYRSLVNRMGPSIFIYNILIKGYAKSSTPLEALKLKEEMAKQGIRPQKLTYNSLILACVKGRQLGKALELLKEMKEEAERLKSTDLLPDITTYSTLIKGFGQERALEGIQNLVDELRVSPRCVIDRIAYGIMIDAYLDAGSPSDALSVFQEMTELAAKNSQLRPRAHAFLSLMRVSAEKGHFEEVQMLHKRMLREAAGRVSPENRVEADELQIEAAIHSGKQLKLARKLLQTMLALKKGTTLSDRVLMAIVRLQALSNFCDNVFSPIFLQEKVTMDEPAGKFMLSIDEMKPLRAELQLSKVIMRFFKDDVLPIMDGSHKCIGVVFSKDCTNLNARLSDLARGPPPTVTASTPISKALSLLLEPMVKLVVVVDAHPDFNLPSHTSNKTIGFLMREMLLSNGDSGQTNTTEGSAL